MHLRPRSFSSSPPRARPYVSHFRITGKPETRILTFPLRSADKLALEDKAVCVCFQEELHHFETKVEKHSHYKEQLELSHQKLQHVENLGDKDHLRRTQEKYNTLSEKTREMGYKVRTCRYSAPLMTPTVPVVRQ